MFAALSLPMMGVFWAQGLGPWWQDLALEPGNWPRWWTMFTSVWLHASIDHVVSNLFALTVLAWLATYTYPRTMTAVIPASVLGAGLAILLLGHEASAGHIGASGISYGLMAMFVMMALLRKTRVALGVFLVVAFLFGAAWWGLLPVSPLVSWEGHLGGAMGGALATLVFWRQDPIGQHEAGVQVDDWDERPPDTAPASHPGPVHSRSTVV